MNSNTTIDQTRRDLITYGALGGLSLLPGFVAAAQSLTSTLPLITKLIPSTGERVPAVGIGTNAFRDTAMDDLKAILARMNELGGSVIDTAQAYGDAEERIGTLLQQLKIRNRFFVATKTPQQPSTQTQSIIDSALQRLKTDRIDLLQVHNMTDAERLLPLMADWKKAGKIRYIGITTSNPQQYPQVLTYLRQFQLDFIQVSYSLGNRDAAAQVFPLAIERKVAVLVNQPLGGRSGPPPGITPPPGPQKQTLLGQAAARQLPPWAADLDVQSWSQYFLKYVISHPAVTAAVPGATKLTHVEDNQRAGHGRLPDADMRKKMEQAWDAED